MVRASVCSYSCIKNWVPSAINWLGSIISRAVTSSCRAICAQAEKTSVIPAANAKVLAPSTTSLVTLVEFLDQTAPVFMSSNTTRALGQKEQQIVRAGLKVERWKPSKEGADMR